MNETKLRTIAQLQDFFKATPQVSISGDDKFMRVTLSYLMKFLALPAPYSPMGIATCRSRGFMPGSAQVNLMSVRERTDSLGSHPYDRLHYDKHEPSD